MTGMKEGAGEDPFADDDDADAGEEDQELEQSDEHTDAKTGESNSGAEQVTEIPYKFRRGSVHDGRDRVPLFLMPETKHQERDAQRELEERFGSDVALTDLRESVMKAGLEHLDDAEVYLEEWGYGLTFEE